MAEECNGFGNTGYYSTCDSNFKAMRGMFITPTYDSTGALNKVTAGTLIDQAFLTARLNDTDRTKRWYPLMGVEAATSERADPTFFDNPSGAKEFVKQGARDLSYELRKRGSEFLGSMLGCVCSEYSVYFVDLEGKFRGMITGVGVASDFYPVKIQPGSFYPSLMQATEDNPEHLLVKFQYGLTEKDELLRTYPDALITANLLLAKGLVDVFMAVSGVSATGFTAALTTKYSNGNKYNPTGLVAGDFALEDVTDTTSISITSVTETAPGSGVYVFVHTSTLTSKTKQLTPTKSGFDFSAVVANTFTTG